MIGKVLSWFVPFAPTLIKEAAKLVGKPELGKEIADGLDEAKLEKLAQHKAIRASLDKINEGQIRQNIAAFEADKANNGYFRSGWRPLIGWICAAGIAWHFIIEPCVRYAFVAAGLETANLPHVPFDDLWSLTLAMLGLAGFRGAEKYYTRKLGGENGG